MLTNAAMVMKLLPSKATPIVVLVTDGVVVGAPPTRYDDVLMQFVRHDMVCHILPVDVGDVSQQACSAFGYVPDIDVLKTIAISTGGKILGRVLGDAANLPERSTVDADNSQRSAVTNEAEDTARSLGHQYTSVQRKLLWRESCVQYVDESASSRTSKYTSQFISAVGLGHAAETPYRQLSHKPKWKWHQAHSYTMKRTVVHSYELAGLRIRDTLWCRLTEGFTITKVMHKVAKADSTASGAVSSTGPTTAPVSAVRCMKYVTSTVQIEYFCALNRDNGPMPGDDESAETRAPETYPRLKVKVALRGPADFVASFNKWNQQRTDGPSSVSGEHCQPEICFDFIECVRATDQILSRLHNPNARRWRGHPDGPQEQNLRDEDTHAMTDASAVLQPRQSDRSVHFEHCLRVVCNSTISLWHRWLEIVRFEVLCRGGPRRSGARFAALRAVVRDWFDSEIQSDIFVKFLTSPGDRRAKYGSSFASASTNAADFQGPGKQQFCIARLFEETPQLMAVTLGFLNTNGGTRDKFTAELKSKIRRTHSPGEGVSASRGGPDSYHSKREGSVFQRSNSDTNVTRHRDQGPILASLSRQRAAHGKDDGGHQAPMARVLPPRPFHRTTSGAVSNGRSASAATQPRPRTASLDDTDLFVGGAQQFSSAHSTLPRLSSPPNNSSAATSTPPSGESFLKAAAPPTTFRRSNSDPVERHPIRRMSVMELVVEPHDSTTASATISPFQSSTARVADGSAGGASTLSVSSSMERSLRAVANPTRIGVGGHVLTQTPLEPLPHLISFLLIQHFRRFAHSCSQQSATASLPSPVANPSAENDSASGGMYNETLFSARYVDDVDSSVQVFQKVLPLSNNAVMDEPATLDTAIFHQPLENEELLRSGSRATTGLTLPISSRMHPQNLSHVNQEAAGVLPQRHEPPDSKTEDDTRARHEGTLAAADTDVFRDTGVDRHLNHALSLGSVCCGAAVLPTHILRSYLKKERWVWPDVGNFDLSHRIFDFIIQSRRLDGFATAHRPSKSAILMFREVWIPVSTQNAKSPICDRSSSSKQSSRATKVKVSPCLAQYQAILVRGPSGGFELRTEFWMEPVWCASTGSSSAPTDTGAGRDDSRPSILGFAREPHPLTAGDELFNALQTRVLEMDRYTFSATYSLYEIIDRRQLKQRITHTGHRHVDRNRRANVVAGETVAKTNAKKRPLSAARLVLGSATKVLFQAGLLWELFSPPSVGLNSPVHSKAMTATTSHRHRLWLGLVNTVEAMCDCEIPWAAEGVAGLAAGGAARAFAKVLHPPRHENDGQHEQNAKRRNEILLVAVVPSLKDFNISTATRLLGDMFTTWQVSGNQSAGPDGGGTPLFQSWSSDSAMKGQSFVESTISIREATKLLHVAGNSTSSKEPATVNHPSAPFDCPSDSVRVLIDQSTPQKHFSSQSTAEDLPNRASFGTSYETLSKFLQHKPFHDRPPCSEAHVLAQQSVTATLYIVQGRRVPVGAAAAGMLPNQRSLHELALSALQKQKEQGVANNERQHHRPFSIDESQPVSQQADPSAEAQTEELPVDISKKLHDFRTALRILHARYCVHFVRQLLVDCTRSLPRPPRPLSPWWVWRKWWRPQRASPPAELFVSEIDIEAALNMCTMKVHEWRLPSQLQAAIVNAKADLEPKNDTFSTSQDTLQSLDGVFLHAIWEQGFRRIPGHPTHFVYVGTSRDDQDQPQPVSRDQWLLEDWPLFLRIDIGGVSVRESLTDCIHDVFAHSGNNYVDLEGDLSAEAQGPIRTATRYSEPASTTEIGQLVGDVDEDENEDEDVDEDDEDDDEDEDEDEDEVHDGSLSGSSSDAFNPANNNSDTNTRGGTTILKLCFFTLKLPTSDLSSVGINPATVAPPETGRSGSITVSSDLDLLGRDISRARWGKLWKKNLLRRSTRLAKSLQRAFAGPALDMMLANRSQNPSVGKRNAVTPGQLDVASTDDVAILNERLAFFDQLPEDKVDILQIPLKTFLQAHDRHPRDGGSGDSDELLINMEAERMVEIAIRELPYLKWFNNQFIVVGDPTTGTSSNSVGPTSDCDGSPSTNARREAHNPSYWMTIRIVPRPDNELMQRLTNDMAQSDFGSTDVRYGAIWFRNVVVRQYVSSSDVATRAIAKQHFACVASHIHHAIHRTNQQLLLKKALNTMILPALLEPKFELTDVDLGDANAKPHSEDEVKDESADIVALEPELEQELHHGSTPIRSQPAYEDYELTIEDPETGDFACPPKHTMSIELHPRLRDASVLSGIAYFFGKFLLQTDDALPGSALPKRHDSQQAVFFIMKDRQEQPSHTLDGEGDDRTVETEIGGDDDFDTDGNDIFYFSIRCSPKKLQNSQGPQFVTMQVHGLGLPSEHLLSEISSLLRMKCSGITTESIQRVLGKNPNFKLWSEDISFIESDSESHHAFQVRCPPSMNPLLLMRRLENEFAPFMSQLKVRAPTVVAADNDGNSQRAQSAGDQTSPYWMAGRSCVIGGTCGRQSEENPLPTHGSLLNFMYSSMICKSDDTRRFIGKGIAIVRMALVHTDSSEPLGSVQPAAHVVSELSVDPKHATQYDCWVGGYEDSAWYSHFYNTANTQQPGSPRHGDSEPEWIPQAEPLSRELAALLPCSVKERSQGILNIGPQGQPQTPFVGGKFTVVVQTWHRSMFGGKPIRPLHLHNVIRWSITEAIIREVTSGLMRSRPLPAWQFSTTAANPPNSSSGDAVDFLGWLNQFDVLVSRSHEAEVHKSWSSRIARSSSGVVSNKKSYRSSNDQRSFSQSGCLGDQQSEQNFLYTTHAGNVMSELAEQWKGMQDRTRAFTHLKWNLTMPLWTRSNVFVFALVKMLQTAFEGVTSQIFQCGIQPGGVPFGQNPLQTPERGLLHLLGLDRSLAQMVYPSYSDFDNADYSQSTALNRVTVVCGSKGNGGRRPTRLSTLTTTDELGLGSDDAESATLSTDHHDDALESWDDSSFVLVVGPRGVHMWARNWSLSSLVLVQDRCSRFLSWSLFRDYLMDNILHQSLGFVQHRIPTVYALPSLTLDDDRHVRFRTVKAHPLHTEYLFLLTNDKTLPSQNKSEVDPKPGKPVSPNSQQARTQRGGAESLDSLSKSHSKRSDMTPVAQRSASTSTSVGHAPHRRLSDAANSNAVVERGVVGPRLNRTLSSTSTQSVDPQHHNPSSARPPTAPSLSRSVSIGRRQRDALVSRRKVGAHANTAVAIAAARSRARGPLQFKRPEPKHTIPLTVTAMDSPNQPSRSEQGPQSTATSADSPARAPAKESPIATQAKKQMSRGYFGSLLHRGSLHQLQSLNVSGRSKREDADALCLVGNNFISLAAAKQDIIGVGLARRYINGAITTASEAWKKHDPLPVSPKNGGAAGEVLSRWRRVNASTDAFKIRQGLTYFRSISCISEHEELSSLTNSALYGYGSTSSNKLSPSKLQTWGHLLQDDSSPIVNHIAAFVVQYLQRWIAAGFVVFYVSDSVCNAGREQKPLEWYLGKYEPEPDSPGTTRSSNQSKLTDDGDNRRTHGSTFVVHLRHHRSTFTLTTYAAIDRINSVVNSVAPPSSVRPRRRCLSRRSRRTAGQTAGSATPVSMPPCTGLLSLKKSLQDATLGVLLTIAQHITDNPVTARDSSNAAKQRSRAPSNSTAPTSARYFSDMAQSIIAQSEMLSQLVNAAQSRHIKSQKSQKGLEPAGTAGKSRLHTGDTASAHIMSKAAVDVDMHFSDSLSVLPSDVLRFALLCTHTVGGSANAKLWPSRLFGGGSAGETTSAACFVVQREIVVNAIGRGSPHTMSFKTKPLVTTDAALEFAQRPVDWMVQTPSATARGSKPQDGVAMVTLFVSLTPDADRKAQNKQLTSVKLIAVANRKELSKHLRQLGKPQGATVLDDIFDTFVASQCATYVRDVFHRALEELYVDVLWKHVMSNGHPSARRSESVDFNSRAGNNSLEENRRPSLCRVRDFERLMPAMEFLDIDPCLEKLCVDLYYGMKSRKDLLATAVASNSRGSRENMLLDLEEFLQASYGSYYCKLEQTDDPAHDHVVLSLANEASSVIHLKLPKASTLSTPTLGSPPPRNPKSEDLTSRKADCGSDAGRAPSHSNERSRVSSQGAVGPHSGALQPAIPSVGQRTVRRSVSVGGSAEYNDISADSHSQPSDLQSPTEQHARRCSTFATQRVQIFLRHRYRHRGSRDTLAGTTLTEAERHEVSKLVTLLSLWLWADLVS